MATTNEVPGSGGTLPARSLTQEVNDVGKSAISPSVSSTHLLFSGKPNFFGGLSNERDLVPLIPTEFRNHRNPWTALASSVFFRGANIAGWSFRTVNQEIRTQQLACFKAALSGFDLQHEDKEALCGWMLSEMLTELPR